MPISLTTIPATSATMQYADQDDRSAELLQQVGAGDTAAFDGIVSRWKNPLIGFFQRSTFCREDAEDLAISTLTKVYFSAPRYRPVSTFPAYLFTIARHQLINFHRKNRSRPTSSLTEDPPDTAEVRSTLNETKEWLESGLRHLPEKARTALLLYAQQGLSYQEIADTLGQTLSATKVQIHRARQQLKSILQSSAQ